MKALRVLAIMMILMGFSILQPLIFNDFNVSTAETEVSGESILTQEIIDEFMRELNDFRAEEGLQPVVYNYDIQAGANIRAGETAIEFDHTRPNGESFSTAFENPNEPIRMENIAGGYATASAVFQGWKDSEGHRANMLIPDLKSVVLGINSPSKGTDRSLYWALIGSGYAELTNENEEESEGEEGSESEEDDVAKEEDDVAKEEADTAKEEDDAAKEEDDAAKEEADTAKEEDDAAKAEADVAKAEADAAKEEADRAKEEEDQAKAAPEQAKESESAADDADNKGSASHVAENEEANEEGQRLPDTASPTWNIMFAGFLFVLGCPMLLMTNRRIKKRS